MSRSEFRVPSSEWRNNPKRRTRDTKLVRGSLLIITLWMIAILSVMAVAIGRSLSLHIQVMKYHLAQEQVAALARGGVYLALERLRQDQDEDTKQNEPVDSLGEAWATPGSTSQSDGPWWEVPWTPDGTAETEPAGKIKIRIIDAERKLNLNAANNPNLQQQLQSPLLDIPPDVAEDIVNYQKPPPAGAPPDDLPKGRPIAVMEELLELSPVKMELFETLEQFSFPFSSEANVKVNINTADQEALVAAGLLSNPAQEGVTSADAKALTDLRPNNYLTSVSPKPADKNGGAPASLDFMSRPPFSSVASRFGVKSDTFIVTTTASLKTPRVQHHVEAVFQRAPQTKIISWKEY